MNAAHKRLKVLSTLFKDDEEGNETTFQGSVFALNSNKSKLGINFDEIKKQTIKTIQAVG